MTRSLSHTLVLALACSTGIMLALCLTPLSVEATTCRDEYASGALPPPGYGAAWNTQSSARELLLRGTTCTDGAADVAVGGTSTYTYRTAYRWTGASWGTMPLAGGTAVADGWYKGVGTTSVPLAGTSTTYVAAYTCAYAQGAYKCGCRDSACATSFWQLQGIARALGSHTSDLEAPPAMTTNPVTFENVCPGDAGWPTYAQMSGRDVKIVLPKDRTCTQRAVLGGYDATPAHNIWVVGGEIDFYSSDTQGSAGITIRYWDGTAFVEGVNIDMNNSCNDGIRTYSAKGTNPRMVIQNSYIRGLGYCVGGTHGDLYHAQGGVPVVTDLVMQNVRGELITQGIFVPYRDAGHGVRRMTLDHVELALDPRYPSTASAQISTMIYAGPYGNDTTDKLLPEGQIYKDVYLNWWDPHYPNAINRKDIALPSPTNYDAAGCAVYATTTSTAAKISGTWCKGAPAQGTFVPLTQVGRTYDRAYFTRP